MSLNTNITNLRELLDKVNALPEASSGVELPTLSNEGIADDLVEGKELIDSTGNIITGTNPYEKVATNNAIAAEANLIAQIQTALEGKSNNTCQITITGDLANCDPIKYFPLEEDYSVMQIFYYDTNNIFQQANNIVPVSRISSLSTLGRCTITCKCNSIVIINPYQAQATGNIPIFTHSNEITSIEPAYYCCMGLFKTPSEPGNYIINLSYESSN